MVIDMTCEWSEPEALRSVPNYLLVPVVDTTRPNITQTITAAKKAIEFLSDPDSGSVYIHCANGYGRSAIIAAAILLLNGSVKTPKDAKKLLQTARPVVSLREADSK